MNSLVEHARQGQPPLPIEVGSVVRKIDGTGPARMLVHGVDDDMVVSCGWCTRAADTACGIVDAHEATFELHELEHAPEGWDRVAALVTTIRERTTFLQNNMVFA